MTSASVEDTSTRGGWIMLLGMLLVALNLRPALTSVAPILANVGADLGLGSLGQGFLNTMPVLCLGLAAPLAAMLATRLGMERAVLAAVGLLAAALLIRPFVGLSGLFIGTAAAGAAIGIMGVLLPGLVKRDFPAQIGLMTGLYTLMLNLGASAAAAFSAPLRLWFEGSWQPALAFWCLPALVAFLVWLLQPGCFKVARVSSGTRRGRPLKLYTDPLAWQVTLYMGLQSSLAYIVFGWWPSMLHARGMSPVDAGLAFSASVLIQGSTALLGPIIGAKLRNQSGLIALVMGMSMIGFAGCFYAPLSSIWWWIVIMGLGQGASFGLALTLLALRAPNTQSANALSGMAQGFGYVLASMGPLAVGWIIGVTSGWDMVGVFMLVVATLAMVVGLGAGRNRLVRAV